MLVQLHRTKTERLRVGTLAKRTGKTVRALHHYEELGLLAPVERTDGGFRLYDADAEVRVRWIAKLQEMGFSLSQIQEILRQWEASRSAPSAMGRVQELYRDKLDETRAQIAKLRGLEADLVASLDYLGACGTCDPNRLIEACSCCEHDRPQEEPDLVAGLHIQAEAQ